MFIQSNLLRDYVFPLCIGRQESDEIKFERFLGSGFLIGSNAFAITAGHVIDNIKDSIFAMFVGENNKWYAFKITKSEIHPHEDVAILKLENSALKSIFCLNNALETQSCEYKQFAYPDDMMYELNDAGKAIGRPDMIYLQGYIRRRTNHPIPSIRGTSLFELSHVGGTGCSGSPIFKITPTKQLRVIGVYVGERLNDRGTSVSYAVREDAIRAWSPQILGHSLLAEAGA